MTENYNEVGVAATQMAPRCYIQFLQSTVFSRILLKAGIVMKRVFQKIRRRTEIQRLHCHNSLQSAII